MADEIKIPIRIEGGEQAEQDLRDVGSAVEGVGTAGRKSSEGLSAASGAAQRSARSQEQAAKAAKGLKNQTQLVDDSAKTFAGGLLGQINPALSSMFNLVTDGVKGLGQMSKSMLAFIGAGAALGGIVLVFQKIVDQAEQARQALERIRAEQRKLRDEAADTGRSLADALAQAGIFGEAGAAEQDLAGLQQRFERELAVFGAVARQVGAKHGRPLSDEEVEAAIAGFLVSGRDTQFEGKPTDLATLEGLITRGSQADAQAALAGRQRDVRTDVQREQIPPEAFDPRARELDALAEQLRRRHALSEEEGQRIRRLLTGEPLESVFEDAINAGEAFAIGTRPPGVSRRQAVLQSIGRERLEGGTRTIQELLEIAEHNRLALPQGGEPENVITRLRNLRGRALLDELLELRGSATRDRFEQLLEEAFPGLLVQHEEYTPDSIRAGAVTTTDAIFEDLRLFQRVSPGNRGSVAERILRDIGKAQRALPGVLPSQGVLVQIKVQNVANQYNQSEREARELPQLEFAQEVISP